MHRKAGRIAGTVIGTIVASAFAMGCSEATPPEDATSSDEEAVVSQDTVALTAEDLADADISETGITFFEPTNRVYNLRPGSIITGVRGDVPFIRRVRRVDVGPGGILFVVGESEEFLKAAPTVRTSKKVSMTFPGIDKSGVTLAEAGSVKVLCSSCFIHYNPSFEFSMETKLGEVQKIGVGFDGELETELEIRVEAFNGGGKLKKEVELASASQRFVQTVGVVPIWEDLSIKLVAGVEGTLDNDAAIVSALKAKKRTNTSVFRQDGEWKVEKGSDGSFTFEQPVLKTQIGASASVYLKLRLEASVYSVAKAFLEGEARGTASAVVCPSPASWNLEGKLGLKAGASLTIPGITTLETDWDLFSTEKKASTPILGLTGVTCK